MAYVKNIWVDQEVERPKTYEVTNNQDGSITLTDSFGLVTELGTPVNEVNMNHIEDGIDGCAIRKYNLTETFNLGEWVLGGIGDDEGIYKSLVPNNLGNAITDDTAWEKVELGGGATRNIGEIISSAIPLTDAGLHLLDGALIQGDGIYSAFVDYIASIYDASANYFCTEAQWQSSVTQYGSCGKFVYDSVNNTVRLPKVSDILQGTTDLTALGDLVASGLPQHTHTRGSMNITGNLYRISETWNFTGSADGAFSKDTGYSATGTPAGVDTSDSGSINFNASNNWTGSTSNANYATTTATTSKVQPQTIKVLYYIVIVTSTKTDIQVDIDEIATDLNRLDTMYQTMEDIVENDTIKTNTISNCITEIPQDIKLELNNGTLTLKAGSKVYVPNGFESDGVTPKFNEIITQQDIFTTHADGYEYMFYTINNGTYGGVNGRFSSNSGSTDTGTGFHLWYDTTNNIIRRYNGSTIVEDNCSLPICIYSSSLSGITNIEQTFNGFGYIGSTVFALPGVKGLAPNGRNEDGTLKNIEYALSRVWTTDGFTSPYIINAYSGIIACYYTNYAAQDTQPSFSNGEWYNTLTNECYKINDNVPTLSSSFIVGNVVVNNGKVTSFTPKKPLQLVDYSDLTNRQVVVETYQNGMSGYRIWSDNWCEQWGRSETSGQRTVTLLKAYALGGQFNISLVALAGSNRRDRNTDLVSVGIDSFILYSEDWCYWKTSGYLANGQY